MGDKPKYTYIFYSVLKNICLELQLISTYINYYFKLATINCCGMYFFRPDLMVKKLRYYARFIVVSLLLNKVDLVKELIQVLYFLIYATPSEFPSPTDVWSVASPNPLKQNFSFLFPGTLSLRRGIC